MSGKTTASPRADSCVGKLKAKNQTLYTWSGIGLKPNLRESGLLIT